MPLRHSRSSGRATLVFDGDCGFCTSSVEWLTRTLPAMPQATPFQWAPLEELGLTLDETKDRVWLVTSDRAGRLHQYGGYLAVSRLLRHQPHLGWRFLGVLLDTPPFSLAAGIGYSLIARFRYRMPGGTPACRTRPTE
ncbi:MAG: DCC1-like thiol-disulfide oxidoreductase family protein [Terrimesophilobacter sp.]